MHFVKKTPTTEEERAAKEKERAVKLRTYCGARDRIFEKRDKEEFDDELLALTGKILVKNPDVYTFWNVRRTTTDLKMAAMDGDNEEHKKQMSQLLADELILTQTCLMEGNPKSYWAWFQRGWVLQKMLEKGLQPDFKAELGLCKKALDLDDRNFHVWDHRRLVSKLANVTDEEELQFSLDRVNRNFSNYSAWHYRSVLLPKVQEKKTGSEALEEDVLKDELEKAATAFFSDPDDQSSYVYSRWLLSIGSCKEFMVAGSPIPPSPLSVTFNGKQTTIVMTKACDREHLCKYVKIHDPQLLKPLSAVSLNARTAIVWVYPSTSHVSVRVDPVEDKWHTVKDKKFVQRHLMKMAFDIDDGERLPLLVVGYLKEKLEELMTLPPISAWTLYMYTLCLMESSPAGSHMKIVDNLTQLAETLDPLRKELYKSLLSRQELNQVLRQKNEQGKSLLDRIIDGEEDTLKIRYQKISSLKGIEFLAGFLKDLCVQGNELKTLEDIQLLPNLGRLDISENPIDSIPALPSLSHLDMLSAAACPISSVNDVISGIRSLPSLEKFIFAETGLSEKAGELNEAIGRELRLIPHWL